MALGERFRSGGSRGIARFLGDHQHCDAGFDVHREPGVSSGSLLVTCLGCGESIAYSAAEPGELAARPAAGSGNGEPGEVPKKLADAGPGADPARAVGGGVLSGRSRLPIALIGILIVAGAALIAIGVTRSGEDPEPASEPAQSTTADAAATATEPTLPEQTQARTTPQPQANVTPQQQRPVRLVRRSFANAFAVGVPRGWRVDGEGLPVSISVGAGGARIRIFYESGEKGLRKLTAGAADFLADKHPDGLVGRPQRIRLGGEPAVRIRVDYGEGIESATTLADGGYSFVLLTRVDGEAAPRVADEAVAAVASFKAR